MSNDFKIKSWFIKLFPGFESLSIEALRLKPIDIEVASSNLDSDADMYKLVNYFSLEILDRKTVN